MELVKPKTQSEIRGERMANGESPIEIGIDLMFGQLRNSPRYNDINELAKRADRDLKNLDFGDMSSYLNDFEFIAEYWKDKAEQYLQYIDPEKYELDKNGDIQEIAP